MELQTSTPHQEPLVVKSNALVEAAYTMTLAEIKVLLAAVAQVRRDEDLTDAITYRLTASALSDMEGFSEKNEYRILKRSVERLYERSVLIHDLPNGEGKPNKALLTRWVQSIRYVDTEGAVEIRFSKDILPYLQALTSEFEQYKLRNIAGMRSTYGVRLYELLIQWRTQGEREIPIDWLKERFGITDKYKSIRDLKRFVIEPGIRDVNDHSDLFVEWGQRKTGRRVTHFQFRFWSKHAVPPEYGNKPQQERREARKRHFEKRLSEEARPGESRKAATDRIRKEDRERDNFENRQGGLPF